MAANAKKPEKPPTAKLFMHGRSQAVRLPKEFRFEGTEVRVSKVGEKVILESRLDAMGAEDFLPEGLPDDPPLAPDDSVSFD
jgi:antitoxin VapB